MATSREELYKAALDLTEGERAELAGLLLESLDSEAEEGVEAATCVGGAHVGVVA